MKNFYLIGLFCLSILISACQNKEALAARNKLRETQTPFSHEAFIQTITDGDAEKTALFIKGEIDTEIGQQNTNPLLVATANNQIEIAQQLINSGAEIDPDGFGGTPLCVAAAKGYDDLVTYFISKGAYIDFLRGDLNPLMLASTKGHKDTVKILMDAGADVNIKGESTSFTPLILASRNGHLETVKTLLSKKGKFFTLQRATHPQTKNYGGHSALDFAIYKGHNKVAKTLIDDPRFEVDRAEIALVAAIAFRRKGVIQELVKKGIDINSVYGSLPILSWAIANNHTLGAKILIESGANIDQEDKLKMLPMDYALTAQGKINKEAQKANAELEELLSKKMTQTKKEITGKEIQEDPAVMVAKAKKAAKDQMLEEIEEIIRLLRTSHKTEVVKE